MSKKALLNENQVRQMMKLASLGGPLTSNFLSETYAGYMDEDEYEDEAAGAAVFEAEEDELEAPDMAELPEPIEAPEDAGPEDAAPEMDFGAPADDVSDKETKFASAIATLADLAGVEVDFGDAVGDLGDMGDAGEEDLAADLEDLGDVGAEAPEAEEEPLDEMDEIDFIDEEEVMNEVYKRVKSRLKEKLIANK
jgi:hypothetical protein